MEVIDAIRNRRSIRNFKNDAVISDEHIQVLLEVAMLAPSARNSRSWEFIVLKSKEMKAKAATLSPYARHTKDASVCIIVCGLEDKTDNEDFFQQNCAAAIENILLEATELGYGTCWCGIYPRRKRTKKFKKVFDIKSTPIALIAIGVSDEKPKPRETYDETKIRYL